MPAGIEPRCPVIGVANKFRPFRSGGIAWQSSRFRNVHPTLEENFVNIFTPHATTHVRRWASFALVASALIHHATASAEPIAPGAVYAYAQQKIYGMTLSATPGSGASLIGNPQGFSVKMSNLAGVDTIPGVVAHNGGLNAEQSFIGAGPPSPSAPPENYSGNVSPGMSVPANERVLLQWNPTGAGVAGGFDASIPVAANFLAGHNFSRADAYVTPNPDNAVGPPTSGTIPGPASAWPPGGTTVATSKLFAPVGTAGTLSIDAMAEALLTDEKHGTIGNGAADWVVTGKFNIVNSENPLATAGVSLDFNISERMVVYSYNPLINIATASNEFAMDVLDSNGRSVFGPFLGTNPSTQRLLSSPATGSETYNNNTSQPTHLYPGPNAVNFQTAPLKQGDYTFTIKGTTTAYVTAVPEPSAGVLAAVALGTLCGGLQLRRKSAPTRAAR
jgi:hypothetical protein